MDEQKSKKGSRDDEDTSEILNKFYARFETNDFSESVKNIK